MPLRREELERSYQALERPLYNFAVRWTWNPASARELVQEAFLKAWENREAVKEETLRGLLFTIIVNLARTHHCRARLRDSIPLLDWVSGGKGAAPDAEFLAKEQQGEIRAVIEGLSLDLREALLLSQFSGLSQDEIGETLGIPAGTVASRRSRALERLREKLGHERTLL